MVLPLRLRSRVGGSGHSSLKPVHPLCGSSCSGQKLSVQTFFWSRTISQETSKQCESGERPSLEVALSFACWKAVSVPHKENGTWNIGPQELDEYLTTKGSSSISVVLRDCFKHAFSLQGLLCQSWPSFHVCGGALCGQLISSHC